jgi:hypothetical protein
MMGKTSKKLKKENVSPFKAVDYLVPPEGHKLMGSYEDRRGDLYLCYIEPSYADGYFYVTVFNMKLSYYGGNKRPFKKEGISFLLEKENFRYESAKWTTSECKEKYDYNHWLYSSKKEYLDEKDFLG